MKRKFKQTVQLLLFVIILTSTLLVWPARVSADTTVRLSNLSPGDTVKFAGSTWIVLNPGTGYLMMRDVLCDRVFDSSGRVDPAFDPSRTTSLAYYLNSDPGGFYYSLLNSCPADAALIQTHAWTTGTHTQTTNNEASSTADAKIGLLSYSEYYTYKNISGVYLSWYWTRTWTSGDTYVWTTCANSEKMYAVPDSGYNYHVRPVLYLNPAVQVSGGNGGNVVPFSAGNSTVSANPASVAVTTSSAVTVQIKDYSGQPMSGIPVQLSSSSATALINNNATSTSGTTDTNGKATFTVADTKAETVTYTAKDTTYNQQLTQTAQVQFTPGDANQLVWHAQPSGSGTAGAALGNQPILYLEDQFGNILTNDNSTQVTLTASDGVTLSGNTLTVSAGVAAFTNLKTSKTGKFTLTASNGGGITSAVSNQITIEPAEANQLIWHTQPSGGTAGTVLSVQPVLYLEDQFGNILTGDNSTQVTLTASNGKALDGNTVAVSAGVATFSELKTNKAGKFTLAASSGQSVISGASDQITIDPTAASELYITTPIKTGAGTPFDVTVTAIDQYGNIATGYTGTVKVTTNGGNSPRGNKPILPQDYTFKPEDSGVHTFKGGVTLYNQGSATFTVSDKVSSFESKCETYSFRGPTDAGQSTVSVSESSITANGANQSVVTVILKDAYGNLVGGSSVKLTGFITGSADIGSSQISAPNGNTSGADGRVVFNVTSTKAESITYTASRGDLLLSENVNVNFTPGPITKLVWKTQPGGGPSRQKWEHQPALIAVDAYDNVVTSDSSSEVVLSLDMADGATLSGTKTITLKNGVAAFNDLSVDRIGDHSLTPSINKAGVTSPDSLSFSITQANAPVITPDGGKVNNSAKVTITGFTSGDAYYSLDGAKITTHSIKYKGQFTIDQSCSVAAAVYDAQTDQWSKSSTANFTIQVDIPQSNIPSGKTAPKDSSIYLTDATAGAKIYYTTDGSTPDTKSESGNYVTIKGTPGSSIIIKAYAVKSGCEDSSISTFTYTIGEPVPITNGNSSNNPPATVESPKTDVGLKVSPKIDSTTGIATANISQSTLDSAFNSLTGSRTGEKTVAIEIPATEGVKAYEPSLPASFLTSGDATRAVEINTELASVTMPGNMIAASIGNANTVSLTIELGDTKKLPEDVRKKIGEKPVIELSLKIDNKAVSWSNDNTPVTISIPYTPTAEELKNPEHITVWYIDGSGNAVPVPNGRFDTATGRVVFSTTHFSKYSVAYVNKTFTDTDKYAWAKKQIEVIASKGIISGTSETQFSPSVNITRADFLMMLVRTLDLTVEFKDNFSDVTKDSYYYKEIGIAKKLGITGGTGNNQFKPNSAITRQDMITLTAKALKAAGKLKTDGDVKDLSSYTDSGSIASYAVEPVSAMVKMGLINGSGNRINPLSNTTRAEAAVLMYRIYNK